MDDYLDAHERHWMDAELLYHNQRWAKGHLYNLEQEAFAPFAEFAQKLTGVIAIG